MEMRERIGEMERERRLSIRNASLSPTPPPPYVAVPPMVFPVSIHSSSSVVSSSSSSSSSQVGVNRFTGPDWENIWRITLETLVNPRQIPFFDASSPGLADLQNRENEGETLAVSIVGPAAVLATPPVPSLFASPSPVPDSSSPSSFSSRRDRPLPRIAQLIVDTAMTQARFDVEEELEARKLAWLMSCSQSTQTTPSVRRRGVPSTQMRPLSTVSENSLPFFDVPEDSSPEPSVRSGGSAGTIVDLVGTPETDLNTSSIRVTPRPRM
jgi:hypothetical protein